MDAFSGFNPTNRRKKIINAATKSVSIILHLKVSQKYGCVVVDEW